MSRDDNRAQYPGVAALVDAVRRYFPDAKLVAAIEGDKEIGKVDAALRQTAREEGIA